VVFFVKVLWAIGAEDQLEKNLFLAMFSVLVVGKNSGGFQTGNVRSRGSGSLAICVSLCK